jgi:hypothetical protein
MVELPLAAARSGGGRAGGGNNLDMSKLSPGERIVMYASAALVVLSFIPLWASYSIEIDGIGGVGGVSESESFSAWSGAYGFLMKLGIILAIVALGLTIARMSGASVTLPPVTYVGLGVGATVLLLIGVVMGPEDGGLGGLAAAAAGFDVSRGILLYVGVVLAAAVAVGGYMHMQAEGATTGYSASAAPPPPPA